MLRAVTPGSASVNVATSARNDRPGDTTIVVPVTFWGPGGGGTMRRPAISPHDPRVAVEGCDMTGSYITKDAGESWRMFQLGWVTEAFAFDPKDEDVIYAGTGALWRSEDGGQSWAMVFPDPGRHTYWYPDFGTTTLLYLNTQKKPFDDKNVRKAVSMAIDRPRIMTEAMSGYTQPADATGIAESQKKWKSAAAQAAPWTRRDVDAANRLLDAAGLARGADGIRTVPGGGKMTYDINTVAGWTDFEAAAGIIKQSLAEVGIAATAVPLPYQAWIERLQRGRFDMGIMQSTRGPTPYTFYRGQMDATLVRPVGEEATDNFQRFASAEAGPVFRRFEAASDPAFDPSLDPAFDPAWRRGGSPESSWLDYTSQAG